MAVVVEKTDERDPGARAAHRNRVYRRDTSNRGQGDQSEQEADNKRDTATAGRGCFVRTARIRHVNDIMLERIAAQRACQQPGQSREYCE
ncbi:hypothetical protein D3C87_1791740 [compost metagenome]